jgi:hypothetical protein
MAIQFVGGNTATKAGGTTGNSTISLTTLTGGISSTAAIGDLVIAIFSTGSIADRTLSISDGVNAYTLIATELYSNGTSNDTNLRVAYRFATVAGGSVTFGPTGQGADAGAMAVYVFRGVSSSVFDVTTTTATGTGTGRPTPPAITPNDPGTIIVAIGAAAAATGAVFTTATLSSFRTVTSSDTYDAMLGVGQFAWTSGTYTPAQFGGGTTGTGDSWAAMTIALRDILTFNETITESVTATDSSNGEIQGQTFNETITESVTATDASIGNIAQIYNETITESVTADESIQPGFAQYVVFQDGSAFNSYIGSTSGGSVTLYANTTVAATGTFFNAFNTGFLSGIRLRFTRGNTTLPLPTQPFTVELWSASGNTLTSLLASESFPLTTAYSNIPGYIQLSIAYQTEFFIAEGARYAVLLRAGSDWISGSTQTFTLARNATTNPDTWPPNIQPAINFTINSTGTLTTEGTFTTADIARISAVYLGGFDVSYANPNFIDADITESVTSTDSFTAGENGKWLEESVTATDSLTATVTKEVVATDSGLIGLNPGVGVTFISFTTANTTSGQSFIADESGYIAGVVARVVRTNTAASLPTQPGTVELWQLASNSITAQPSTLLASNTFNLADISTSVTLFQFLFTPNTALLSSGTGYAVLLRAGSDWSASTQYLRTNISAGISTLELSLAPFIRAVSGVGPTYTITSQSRTTMGVMPMSQISDVQTQGGVFNADITESVTATDSQDAGFIAGGDVTESVTATDIQDGGILVNESITESVTATDSSTNTDTARAWLTENTVSVNGGFVNVYNLVSAFATFSATNNNTSVGVRFIANQTAVVGIALVSVWRVAGTTNPVQPVKVTLWQLASNSLTALPSTNLGEVSVTFTSIPTPAGFISVDFTALNITLTSGVGYALTVSAPSDITGTGSTLQIGYISTSGIYIPPNNYYRSIYSNINGTYPSTYSNTTSSFLFDIQPVQATADTQEFTAAIEVDITESVTATDTQDALFAVNVDITESVTAADSSITDGSTYNVSISESVNATDTSDATSGAVVSVSGVQGTGQTGSLTVTAGANVTLTGVFGTGQTGTVTTSAGASVSLTGVQGTGQTGTLNATGTANVTTTGVSGTGQVGDEATSADANVYVVGEQATGQTGTLNATGTGNVTLTGVQGTGQTGSVTVDCSVDVPVTGEQATGATGTVSVTGGATATTTGVFGTGQTGVVTITGNANTSVIGVQGTGQLGDVAVFTGEILAGGAFAFGAIASSATADANADYNNITTQGAVVYLTGVQGTGQTGTVTVSAGATAITTGVFGTGQTGTLNATGTANVTTTGVSGTGQVGDEATSADANAYAIGVFGTGQTGTITMTGDNNVTLTGVQAIGVIPQHDTTNGGAFALGPIATAPIGDAYANIPEVIGFSATSVTGVVGTGEVGTVAMTGDANVPVMGVSGAGQIGDEATSADANVYVSGLQASGQVGTVTVTGSNIINVTGVFGTLLEGVVTVAANADVPTNGVFGTGQVGDVTTTSDANVYPTGVQATGQIGFVIIESGYVVTGVQATGYVGTVLVWSDINDNQNPNWQAINDDQVGSWTDVNDTQTSNWQNVDDSQTNNWVEVDDGNTVIWSEIKT